MTGDTQMDQSEVYDILRNDRRRHVIEQLREEGGRASVGDLADTIAEMESGESPPPRNVRQSVYVSLHQTHLPKLDEAGVISYESVSKHVELLEGAEEVTVYMEVVPKHGLRSHELVVAVSLVGTVLLELAVAVLGPGLVGSALHSLAGRTRGSDASPRSTSSSRNHRSRCASRNPTSRSRCRSPRSPSGSPSRRSRSRHPSRRSWSRTPSRR